MALSHTKIKLEVREILLKDRPSSLYDISPKGTVPVLQLLNKDVIDESLDIMIWCLKNSNSDWINFKLDDQLLIINQNDNQFKYWLDRYKYFDRYPDNNQRYYQIECEKFLNQYEGSLNRTEYLIDNKLRLVDVALFPFIRQYANVDQADFKKKFIELNIWLEKIIESDLFISVMNKYPVWSKDNGIITDFRI